MSSSPQQLQDESKRTGSTMPSEDSAQDESARKNTTTKTGESVDAAAAPADHDDDDVDAPPNKKRKTTRARSKSPEREIATLESLSQETAASSLQDNDDDEDKDEDDAVFYQWIGSSTGRRRQHASKSSGNKDNGKHKHSSSSKSSGQKVFVYYNAIQVQLDKDSEPFVLQRGDAVQLWGSDATANKGDGNDSTNNAAKDEPWICRIESLFEIENLDKNGNNDNDNASHASAVSSSTTSTGTLMEPHFTGRWFYSRTGLVDLLRNYPKPAEAAAANKLLPSLQPDDLVLSNLQEKNVISTIQKKCLVLYGDDAKMNQRQDSGNGKDDDTYTCRFRLNWDKALKSFTTRSLTESSEAGVSNSSSSSLSETDQAKNDAVMDDESDEDSLSARFQHVIQEGEGSTLRANISVGPQYQVPVGPFVPNQTVASRNPVCVWKPDCLSQSEMERFATDLASLHTEYLRQEQLTILNEPYTPVRSSRVEQLMQDMYGEKRFMTGSTLSTAASMLMDSSSACTTNKATKKKRRIDLRKECDVDSVLHLLSVNNCNIEHALASAEENLHLLTTPWSVTEREIFDESYRKNHGSLSAVAKALAPTKTLKQVIDYFYRFKIPDQFRLYQNKKREQAVHLMECIEKKRGTAPIAITVPSSTTLVVEDSLEMEGNNDNGATAATRLPETTYAARVTALPSQKNKRWTEVTVENTVHALQDRRMIAKKLLLEIDTVLGKDVLTKVAVGIERLHSSYDRDTKEDILRELRKQPELQRRLLEFLPRDV